nr:ATP synthase F0 subunit 8 [Atelerix albiventris]
MPQLDTSSWLLMILSMMFTLFIMMQLKFSSYKFYMKLEVKKQMMYMTFDNWNHKWTKIYLPLSLPQHF